MAINQNIGTFINTFIKRDGQRNNLFRVLALNTKVINITEEDAVYIRTGKLPGRTNPVASMKYMGMDFYYNTSSIQYTSCDNIDMEFIFDAKHEIRTKFEQASRRVFNDLTTSGTWNVPTLQDIMTIATLDNQCNPSAQYHFYGVAFKGPGEVQFQIGDGDGQMLTLATSFSYYYYKGPGSDTVYAATSK